MTRNPLIIAGLAAAMALPFGAAQAQMQPQSSPNAPASMSQKASKADQKFIKEAIEGDLAEVNVGKLAQQKGQADDVKNFGQTLQQDHGQNLQQAQQLAQQMGMTPPSEPNAKQKAIYRKLEKASGATFDREFKQAMIKDHKQDIAMFRKQAKKKSEAGQFAQQTLPALQKHLQMAQSLGRSSPTTGSR